MGRRPPRLVALGLDRWRQLGAAAGDDATVDQEVHDVGDELLEQALVVRDGEHAELGALLAHGAHASADDAQRIDVEARVRLVEHGHERLEQRHLEDLVALLLAARRSPG